jgi:NAD(P)H dehydrogenase (quinone)
MKVLILLAHPEPQSMNGALFTTAIETLEAAGHQVRTSDLYAMRFNPISDQNNFTRLQDPAFYKQQLEELHATETDSFAADIESEQQKVEWCDLMIWQFPLWWFSVPGILKGWVDRVFAMGRFYGQGRIYEQGVFRSKLALLSLTTGGTGNDYEQKGLQGDIHNMLKPIHRGMLRFTGFSVLTPHIIYGPARLSPDQRRQELDRWKNRLLEVFRERPVEVGAY